MALRDCTKDAGKVPEYIGSSAAKTRSLEHQKISVGINLGVQDLQISALTEI